MPSAIPFWHRAEWSEDCWEWRGRKKWDGYGTHRDGTGRQTAAHRVAYMLAIGPIPEGMEIDHLCRNRGCVNPAHLEPVTPRTNSLRSFNHALDRARQAHCIHGHPFDEANTYLRSVSRRGCRTCNRLAVARYKARRMATA